MSYDSLLALSISLTCILIRSTRDSAGGWQDAYQVAVQDVVDRLSPETCDSTTIALGHQLGCPASSVITERGDLFECPSGKRLRIAALPVAIRDKVGTKQARRGMPLLV
jgi:hypothetical protein